MLVVCGAIEGIAIMYGINQLGEIFKYTLYYIYGRTNEHDRILVNLLPIRAPYLIWYIVFFEWLLEAPELKSIIISLLLGHSVFFLLKVMPELHFWKKVKLLDPPLFL